MVLGFWWVFKHRDGLCIWLCLVHVQTDTLLHPLLHCKKYMKYSGISFGSLAAVGVTALSSCVALLSTYQTPRSLVSGFLNTTGLFNRVCFYFARF